MDVQAPSLFARIWLAIVCLLRIVFDPEFAREVKLLRERGPEPSGPYVQVASTASGLLTGTPVVPTPAASPTPGELVAEQAYTPAGPTAREGALHLLALLQRDGRLLDFCEEELTGFSDANVGAAARTVHAGCRKVLREHLALVAIRSEREGAPVAVEKGFDAAAIRLTGNVVGNPPFRGTLRHHGWRAAEVKLPAPTRGDAAALLAPAEVELP